MLCDTATRAARFIHEAELSPHLHMAQRCEALSGATAPTSRQKQLQASLPALDDLPGVGAEDVYTNHLHTKLRDFVVRDTGGRGIDRGPYSR